MSTYKTWYCVRYMAGKQTKGKLAYSGIVAERLCEQLMMGKSLTSICKQPGMPSYVSVMKWIDQPDEIRRPGFAERVVKARQMGWDYIADEILDISDDSSKDKKFVMVRGKRTEVPNTEQIARDRLRVDTRKWILSKRNPAIFGEKQQIDVNIDVQLVTRLQSARDRVQIYSQNAIEGSTEVIDAVE